MSPLQVPALFLAEITCWDPALGATKVLRYASGNGYTTGPAATPANTWYDARIAQPVDVSRTLFTGGNTQGGSRVGVGDLILLNPDGLLDDLIGYGFDGRSLTIYRSTVYNPQYPADFTTAFVGTMAVPEFGATTVTLKIRDLLYGLTLPIQPTKFAGTNALPAGVEGVATDLQGKPKPICVGSVSNIAPPCVNTSKLIYQVHDGVIANIPAVYDRGVKLYGGGWANASAFTNFDQVWSCCFGNGLYVAVGYDSVNLLSRVSTSPDGVTWTPRSSGITEQNFIKWYGVTWSPSLSLFVAAGANGLLITSPDGVTWTSRTSGFGATRIIGVSWGSGPALFVAVGVGGVLTTSPDGVTWTARTSNAGGVDLNSVTYGNGLFVAAGSGGTIVTSPDGLTWTFRATSFGASIVRSITFGTSVSGVGTFVGVGDGGIVITSVDGVAWAQIRKSGVTTNLYRIAFAAAQFIAVGQTGTLISSPNGIDWTAGAPGFGTTYIYDLCYGTSGWLLVGDLSKYTMNGYASYGTAAALQDDTQAPAAGEVRVYSSAAGSYFRLGSSPAGTITADVLEGTNAAARTAGQLFARVLARAGYSVGAWSAADVTALDAINSAVLGDYIDSADTPLALLDRIVNSIGGAWWPSAAGVFRIKQFAAPSGTPVLSITANDLLKPLALIATNDPGNGLPVYRSTVQWGKAFTVQTSDLAGGVTAARRAVVAQEWRTAIATDLTVQASNLLSPETIEDSQLTTATDAQAEANRRLALRKVQRNRYEVLLQLNAETSVIDVNDVIELVHSRYGLSVVGSDAGSLFRVLDAAPNAKDGTLRLSVWGRSTTRNRVTSTGAYRVTSTGAYRVTTRVP